MYARVRSLILWAPRGFSFTAYMKVGDLLGTSEVPSQYVPEHLLVGTDRTVSLNIILRSGASGT